MSIRPQMDKDAPWYPKYKRDTNERAVVYVIAKEGGDWIKIGCTSALKRRLNQLEQQTGERLHIMFWAEFYKDDALRVEALAIRTLANLRGRTKREWFDAQPDIAAGAIVNSAARNGYRPLSMAGDPCAYDPQMNEVQEILAEPFVIQGRASHGRVDREEWAPQKNAIGC
jgi:hypothetical protein